jgi:hypothetical protein
MQILFKLSLNSIQIVFKSPLFLINDNGVGEKPSSFLVKNRQNTDGSPF